MTEYPQQDGIRATHCIAADGVHSTVRQLLGIPFDGFSFDDRFIIADVRVDLDFETPERRFYFDPPWNPGRQVLLHPQPKGVWRIDWQVAEDVQLTDDHVRAIVGDRPYEIVWQSTYRFHQRRAKTLRDGQSPARRRRGARDEPVRRPRPELRDLRRRQRGLEDRRRPQRRGGPRASSPPTTPNAVPPPTRTSASPATPCASSCRQRRRTARRAESARVRRGHRLRQALHAVLLRELTADRRTAASWSPGSRAAGPGFTVPDERLIRPDGHVAGSDDDRCCAKRWPTAEFRSARSRVPR